MNLYKYLFLICLGMLFACEKEIRQPGGGKEPPINEEDERIKERIYYYYNQQSLWTDDIPDRNEEERKAFVRSYASNEELLDALMNMTPIYNFRPYSDGQFVGNRYDRYSFLDESDSEGNMNYADGFRMDTNDGYGLYFYWGVIEENSEEWARPVIYFVEGGSPGQEKGIKRGLVVLAINDREDTRVPVIYRNGRYYLDDENLAQTIHNEWYTAMDRSELVLKLRDMEGEINDYTLDHVPSYEIDPIILDSVYTYPNKKIGYLAYSSFEEVDDSPGGNRNRQKLDGIFESFEDADINDLILDLRYNNGGYVETAEYLADKLVNASDDGELMFTYEVNEYLTSAPLYRGNFQDVFFENSNNQLALENVYVLVTEQTASAAELLISALKPYLNVILIAETDRTYGKPVGFFPENITDDVTLWVTSFKTINADGYTDYWDGMEVDVEGVNDYIFKDFGDPTEDMIAEALNLAGVSTTSGMRASSRMGTSAQRGVKLGIINKPRERNMLKNK